MAGAQMMRGGVGSAFEFDGELAAVGLKVGDGH